MLSQLSAAIKSGIDNVDLERKRWFLKILRLCVDVYDKRQIKLTGILPVSILPVSNEVTDLDSLM